MDILEQYEEQNPEASSHALQREPSEGYGGLTRFVIRISRGRIQNEKQANAVLIVLAVCMFILSIIVIFNNRLPQSPKGLRVPVAGPQDLRLKTQ